MTERSRCLVSEELVDDLRLHEDQRVEAGPHEEGPNQRHWIPRELDAHEAGHDAVAHGELGPEGGAALAEGIEGNSTLTSLS